MTKEDKELLLRNLCARLQYGVKIHCNDGVNEEDDKLWSINTFWGAEINAKYSIECVKPYLRPMSSITEEEKEYIRNKYFYEEDWDSWNDLLHYHYHLINVKEIPEFMEWIYAHHFDFLNLIEKSLAFEAPECMYNN